MTRRITARVAGLALFLCGGIASLAGSACGQTAKEIAGTYTLVSFTNQQADKTTDTYGPNPKGVMMLDANGRYVVVLMRPDLPRFASNNRSTGTPAENASVVQGSISTFGTYSVGGQDLAIKIEQSTFPNWVGTDQKRTITITGDEMKWTNQAGSGGGVVELVFKRAK